MPSRDFLSLLTDHEHSFICIVLVDLVVSGFRLTAKIENDESKKLSRFNGMSKITALFKLMNYIAITKTL